MNARIEILIVEDSPTQAEQLKYIFEQHNYGVSVAYNGKEALAFLSKHKPTIVISDIIMPEMDGYQLCEWIKTSESFKDIPVILVTSLSNPEDIIKGLECGADNFIVKPYDENYLLYFVRHILMNKELSTRESVKMGMEIFFKDKKYFITTDRMQILNLLLTTYETAVQKNIELIKAQNELRKLNEQLEKKVEERTSELIEEITERKRAEEEIQRSERKFKDLTETTTDWVWEVDSQGVYTYASPKVKDILGYEPAEILGKTPFEFMPEEEAEKILNFFKEKVINKERFYGLENVNRHKDGHLVVLETNGIPILDEKGELKGYRGIDRDITERKQAEEEIRLYQRRIETLINSSKDLIFLKDKDFRHLIVNKAHEKLFNIKVSDIIGKADCDYMPEEIAERCRISDEKALISEQSVEGEYSFGDRWFHVIKQRVTDEKGEIIGIAGIIRDVTERKRADEEVQKKVNELERFYEMAIGRELRMVELKEEIERLENELKKYKNP